MESAGIAVQLRAGHDPKLLFLQRLKAANDADSATGWIGEIGQIANKLTATPPPHANILTLQLRF
jgi:hypothetical protein